MSFWNFRNYKSHERNFLIPKLLRKKFYNIKTMNLNFNQYILTLNYMSKIKTKNISEHFWSWSPVLFLMITFLLFLSIKKIHHIPKHFLLLQILFLAILRFARTGICATSGIPGIRHIWILLNLLVLVITQPGLEIRIRINSLIHWLESESNIRNSDYGFRLFIFMSSFSFVQLVCNFWNDTVFETPIFLTNLFRVKNVADKLNIKYYRVFSLLIFFHL